MEPSELPHLQQFVKSFELDYLKYESKKHRHQLKNTFPFIMEEVFETLETEYVDITTTDSSNMIETVLKRYFFNTFNHHNEPNQNQHIHKHTDQHYKSIPFQRSKNSPTYLKYNCFGCVLNKK